MKFIYYILLTIYYLPQRKNGQSSIINSQSDHGQALITLLFFVVIGMTVIAAAAAMLYANVTAGGIFEQSSIALSAAESGAENAILRLLRNPQYTGESPLVIGDATVTISVVNNIILATASANDIKRTVQVQTVYNNNTLQIVSWKEVN